MTESTVVRVQFESDTPKMESTPMAVRNPLFRPLRWRTATKGENLSRPEFGQRVEGILWLGISYTTIAGLISSWGAGIAAISPYLFWRQWFFWLGLVWIIFYCVYFIREAKERGRQLRDHQ